ncbi:hypothetical protein QVD17_09718 [Tagetes erecta]|uniref:Uncharacterized protein n=1 Tax=Tagetes erecta TaxID=13708 RepID=A0AAD8L146_TARER|nr:hypothetical protein QVD17_09718 [Tagetes erecta]
MKNDILFRSEVELGKFLGSADIISEAYRAISQTKSTYKVHDTTRPKIKVLAFKCPPDYDTKTPFLEKELDLVSSTKPHLLNFITTKVNSSFSLNKAAVCLFQNLSDNVKELENKTIDTPLIITGSDWGGYLAILYTLHLHHAIDVKESNDSKTIKRPICITFGSPLVGDKNLQGAIAERPQWKYSFLNVVANKDSVASFYSSNTTYKPFGTFLFCNESGGHAAFDVQESILLVLDAIKSPNANAGNLQIYDYNNVLSLMRRKILYRGDSELGELDMSLLRAGITLQLKDVGVLGDISNEQVMEIEKQSKLIRRRKNPYEPTKKLNEMKISLTYMEWYMKKKKLENGYYDGYKNSRTKDEIKSQSEILKNKRKLSKYWKDIVEEKDKMPQKEGAKLRKRWLYGGTNFRRIVEPLEIGEYYKDGKTNYIENREDHYKLLEKWSDEDKKDSGTSDEKRNKAASLTEDSCFWAYVEEALISLRNLENEGSSNIETALEKFEDYAMSAIKNYSVSPEIFIKGSSFMKWWEKYKTYKGNAYASEFARYMNNVGYKSYM